METSFSDGEYDRRLAAVREEAEKERLGALLFFNPSSICYLCGFTTINLWDVSCLIVPPAGDPVLVFREFESGRFTASCRFTGHVSYPPDGRAAPAIVRALRELCALNEMAVEMGRHLDTASLPGLQRWSYRKASSFVPRKFLLKVHLSVPLIPLVGPATLIAAMKAAGREFWANSDGPSYDKD